MGHGGATPARKGNLCSVVRCVRFVVGGAGWSAGGRKWKVNDAKTGNGILWIVGNRLPVPLLARARTSRARPRSISAKKKYSRPSFFHAPNKYTIYVIKTTIRLEKIKTTNNSKLRE